MSLARNTFVFVLYALAYSASLAVAGPPRLRPLALPSPDLSRASLVFVVDAPYAIKAVVLADQDGDPAASLELGSNAGAWTAHTFALPPGRYRIATIHAPDFDRKPFKIVDAPWFTIAPGRLNYIGDLELYFQRDDLMARLINRSGRLIVHLRANARPIADSAELAFVGGDDDGWVSTLGGTR